VAGEQEEVGPTPLKPDAPERRMGGLSVCGDQEPPDPQEERATTTTLHNSPTTPGSFGTPEEEQYRQWLAALR
jgi:hypothetical protein